MLFMVIERFKNHDPVPVYRRFREQGRMMPEELKYIESWVDAKLDRCFQLMECDDASSLKHWTDHWEDLVEFEIVAVVSSSEAAAAMAPRL